MNLHLENELFAHHPITQFAKAMPAINAGWMSSRQEGIDAWMALRNREVKFLQLKHAEQAIVYGLPQTEYITSIVHKNLPGGGLASNLNPAMSFLHNKAMTYFDGIWWDLEDLLNSNPECWRLWPGAWQTFQQVRPNIRDNYLDAESKTAVYLAGQAVLEALGFDSTPLIAWGAADRPTGWGGIPDAIQPIQCPVARPHFIYTVDDQWTTDRIQRELESASGPEAAVVHLDSSASPDRNHERLTLFKKLRVPDVILFGAVTIPTVRGGDAVLAGLSNAQMLDLQRAAGNEYLDRQMPVFADFAS